jgi:hypothetical protein
MWGLLNSKPPEPILMIDNHKYWAAVITLFFGGAQLCCTLYQPRASSTNLVQENQFPELNRHILTFSQWILLSGVTYWTPLEML